MSQSEVFTGPRLRAAQTTLAILVAVNVMSQLDRQIMNVLLPKVQEDLQLSDVTLEALRVAEAPAEYFVARNVGDVMTQALATE